MAENDLMEKIVSLCKRRGFVYPGSEIYGGLAGMWDYGPLGVELKNNIKDLWWQRFVRDREDMYGVDAAILMNQKVWQATGHVATFTDPLENGKSFNTMLKTQVGALEPQTSYLRPETAQGMFANFKNVVDSFHPKLPFGLAQVGKAFRNEIAPRDFLFRSREFEQMEIEYFVRPAEWEKYFEAWRLEMLAWIKDLGLDLNKIHEHEVAKEDRAFYSERTIDFEFDFPFGEKKELYGLAYRTDYDLKRHMESSGVDLSYLDEDSPADEKQKFISHVIEPTFGLDRTVLAVLSDAYHEDEMNGEKRVWLKLDSKLAPIKAAIFPLLKNKPELVAKAQEIYQNLRSTLQTSISNLIFDDNGNIGKRYRRQDEIGTPHCVTIDFQTLDDDTVTVRDRDTGTQERVKTAELSRFLSK